jgi:hypothetical protein
MVLWQVIFILLFLLIGCCCNQQNHGSWGRWCSEAGTLGAPS